MKEVLIELGVASEETKGTVPGACGETLAGPFIYADGEVKPNGEPCDS
ncbi:MAG: hypothetical protein AAGF72_09230 [Pseudomonadota bacterium]